MAEAVVAEHKPAGTLSRGRGKGPLVTFCAAFLAIAITVSFSGYHQFSTFRQTKLGELTAIADLKSAQISNWYGERMSDARVIAKSAPIQRQAVAVLEHRDDLRSRRELLAWMETVREEFGYQCMALYGADEVARCVTPANEAAPDVESTDIQGAMRSGKVLAQDLRRDEGKGARGIHFDVLIPVGEPGAVKGVWLLRLNPYRSLYPLVQSWATPSTTAEILLVRQDGGDVLFLNELRHHPQSAGILRRSMDRYSSLAATQAIKGREGIVERPDYREVPTLAATRRVAGTPWSVVVKMDSDEIYAPLRQTIWPTVILGSVLAAIAALVALVKHK